MLSAALTAVTGVVLGVILNLAICFPLDVIFDMHWVVGLGRSANLEWRQALSLNAA